MVKIWLNITDYSSLTFFKICITTENKNYNRFSEFWVYIYVIHMTTTR